jgi:hypothetical protein
VTAAWVFSDYTYTAASPAPFIPSTLLSPANGATLSGTSATFQWTAGTGVSEYWLYVSNTAAGNAELYNASQGTSLSHTVTGLPSNGSQVYVRLYSKNAATNVWVFNDYTFVATGTGFVAATMISPANGATIGATSAAFQWTTGTAATQYWLYVSKTAVGNSEIYNADQGTATSHTVTGLPNNGTPIYVRLWSKNAANVWLYVDYSYK